uniref:DUF148 domain-containing protein n=1 Tax=Trichobilharzia regenti TaxID=157069 RepID=A0AA85KC04_TRIRE|nr:unnamed protein product [Trichobilharzia regenti]
MKALLLICFVVLLSTEYVQGAALKKIVGEWLRETFSKIINHFFQGGVSNMLNHAINESVGEMMDTQKQLNPDEQSTQGLGDKQKKEERDNEATGDNSDFLSGVMRETQQKIGDKLSDTANELLKGFLKSNASDIGKSKFHDFIVKIDSSKW